MTAALVAGAVLAVACVVLVALPFLREPKPRDDRLAAPDELERRRLSLAEDRDRALAALKELEFDHRTGKVSDDDYRSLVGPLRRRAAEALRARSTYGRSTQVATAFRPVAECPHCGAELAADSRYCAQCGRPVDGGETKTIELPADETGPVPVEYAQAERRVYGVPPAPLALLLAAVALAFAVLLLVNGDWPFALLLIGASLLLVLVFLEASKRRPERAAGRSSTGLVGSFRARTGAAAESVLARGRTAGQLVAYRRELKQIGSRRTRLLFELGDAVYRGDEQTTKTTREQVKELDELAARRGAEMEEIVAQTRDRLQRRKLEVQPTEIVEQPSRPEEEPS